MTIDKLAQNCKNYSYVCSHICKSPMMRKWQKRSLCLYIFYFSEEKIEPKCQKGANALGSLIPASVHYQSAPAGWDQSTRR